MSEYLSHCLLDEFCMRRRVTNPSYKVCISMQMRLCRSTILFYMHIIIRKCFKVLICNIKFFYIFSFVKRINRFEERALLIFFFNEMLFIFFFYCKSNFIDSEPMDLWFCFAVFHSTVIRERVSQ